MPKTKISEFSATPGNNTDIDGINIAEGCAPSGINDAIRELMSQLKDFQAGTAGDSFNGPVGTTTAAAGAFTTLSASSTVTLSGGTANGVPYLNGSKVLTTGSALTFDGTKLINTSGVAGAIIQSKDTQLTGSFLRILADATSAGNLINWTTGTPLRFATSDESFGTFAEQMRLTSTGLGIGTSSPSYKLDVNGAARAKGTVWVDRSSTAANAIVNWSTNGTYDWQIYTTSSATPSLSFYQNGVGDRMTLDSSGNLGLGVTPATWSQSKALQINSIGSLRVDTDTVGLNNNAYYNSGWKYLTTATATSYEQVGGVHKWYTAPSGTAGAAITFTQAMTLDANNNLLVGTTTTGGFPSTGFVVNYNSGSTYVGMGHANGTASGIAYISFGYNGGQIGSITQSGTTAVLYNTTSDQRLKENIQDADSASALIDSLQVRKFDWKADGSHQRYGFVAQELVTVAPEAVHQPEDPEEMMAVDYSKLVPMLVKEIQSLRARVAQLESN